MHFILIARQVWSSHQTRRTYDMAQSTTNMPCNFSGHYDFEAYPELGKFGLATGMLQQYFEQTPGHGEGTNKNIPDGYCQNNTT